MKWDSGLSGWSIQAYLAKATTAAAAAAPVAAASLPITHTLALGWTGEEVSALQAILKRLGMFTDEVTGYFGSITEQAVKQFQAQNNLSAVGIVGPMTREVLNQMAQ